MIKTETATINGRDWQCTQFTGTKNFDVLYSVASIVGPSLARVIDTKAIGKNVLEADVNFGTVADTLFKGLGKSADALALVHKILQNTHVDGKPMSQAVFDDVFAGPSIQDLVPVLAFAMRTNFGDFTKAAGLITEASAAIGMEDQ